MAVTSWTSESMDWTVDHTAEPPRWPYLEALRLAAIERAQLVGLDIPASLTSPIVSGSTSMLGGWLPILPSDEGWYYSDFETLMNELFAAFVNHTDHSGNWSGQATVAPYWTEADLLTAIGASARLYQRPRSAWPTSTKTLPYPLTWAYVKQQYNLLNKLRWTKAGFANISSSERQVYAANWAAAVAAFNASAWISAGTSYVVGHRAYFYSRFGVQEVEIWRGRSTVRFNKALPSGSTLSTTKRHSWDLYQDFSLENRWGAFGSTFYGNSDYPACDTANIYQRTITGTVPSSWPQDITMGDFGDCTVDDPSTKSAPYPSNIYRQTGWEDMTFLGNPQPVYVAKWDVTGGLCFVN